MREIRKKRAIKPKGVVKCKYCNDTGKIDAWDNDSKIMLKGLICECRRKGNEK
jgi:hypothetical protein